MKSVIYLAAPGGTAVASEIAPMIPARLDYRVSPDLRLLQAGGAQGGAMVLGSGACDQYAGSTMALCRQILRECRQQGYTALAADFSPPVREPLSQTLALLAPELSREGIALLVSPAYAEAAPEAQVLLPCQFREGSLRSHLEKYRAKWGDRAALDLSRMCHCFPPQGAPQLLTRDELRRLKIRLRPMSFYSRDLYTNYFTYRSSRGLHLVLFDEENTLRQKLILAKGLGFSSIFLLYQEVEDLLPRLLQDLRRHGTMGP